MIVRTGWPRPGVVSGVVAVMVIAVVLIAARQDRGGPSTQQASGPATTTPATAGVGATSASAPASPASVGATAPPTRAPRLRDCIKPEVPLKDVANVLYLPSTEQAGPIVGQVMPVINGPTTPGSGPAEWVERHYVAYSMSGGAVSRRLELIGPDKERRAYNYYDPVNDLDDDTPTMKSSTTIGGITRDFWVNPKDSGEPWIFVYWTEPGGMSWAALSDGISEAEMRSALAGVRIAGDRVRTGAVPPGFSTWAPLAVRSSGDRPTRSVQANFHRIGANAAWEFFVNDGKAAALAPFRGQPIRIGREPGWWTPPSAEYRIGGIVNWDHEGLHFTFRAWSDPQLPRDQAIAIAASVTKVSPDDPLLFAGCKG